MTEILTESFCERCGTRYTFESARPRTRLTGVRVLSRGLKNFVLSDDASMDEAMAAARSETDRELTARQLDAFHATFNFCMTCRQYTCPNCWNEVEARCLTCAPHLGHEIMPAPFPDLATSGLLVADPLQINGANGSNGTDHGVASAEAEALEPEDDGDGVDLIARLEALTAARGVVEAETPAEPAAEVEAPVEAVIAAEPAAEVEAPVEAVIAEVDDRREDADRLAALEAGALIVEAATPDAPTPSPSIQEKAAAQTSGLLQRFRPGQDVDADLDAYKSPTAPAPDADGSDATPSESETAAIERAVVSESVDAAEPSMAVPEVDSTPVVDDVVLQPTWRMVAPDPTPDAPAGPPIDPGQAIQAAAVAADPSAEPQWPDRPEWLGQSPARGLPFLGRPAAPQGGLEALWAESTLEVVAPLSRDRAQAAVQPCISCGLSLSATARFCRRCGTSQPG